MWETGGRPASVVPVWELLPPPPVKGWADKAALNEEKSTAGAAGSVDLLCADVKRAKWQPMGNPPTSSKTTEGQHARRRWRRKYPKQHTRSWRPARARSANVSTSTSASNVGRNVSNCAGSGGGKEADWAMCSRLLANSVADSEWVLSARNSVGAGAGFELTLVEYAVREKRGQRRLHCHALQGTSFCQRAAAPRRLVSSGPNKATC